MSELVGNVPARIYARAERLGEIVARRWYALNRERCPYCWDEDDARAAARFGVYMAAQQFDPARGFRFNTLATRYALGFVQRDVMRALDIPKTVRRSGTWTADLLPVELDRRVEANSRQRFGDLLPDRRTTGDPELWAVVERLPHAEAEVLRLRYVDGYTRPELEQWGYTRAALRRLERDGLARLREWLGGEA